jgi:hypothetical protein
MAVLIVSGVDAKGKPDRPGGPGAEEIEFSGVDLQGWQIVEGCCPNAGPFPDYTLTLTRNLGELPAGTHDGQLFVNYYGAGRNRQYVVQFWNALGGIEIIGGVIHEDRPNKVTTVEFTNEACLDLDTGETIAVVNFVLVRSSPDGAP